MQESKQEVTKVSLLAEMAKIYYVYPVILKQFSGFKPIMPSGLFHLNSLDRSISSIKGFLVIFIITRFYSNSCIQCNR